MQTMSQASDPITVFQQAKEAGNISVTGNNMFSNLKVNAGSSNMDMLKFFLGVLSDQGSPNRGIQPGTNRDNTSPKVQTWSQPLA